MRPSALLFDLNGTLCDDEGVLFEIYAAMLAPRGVALSRAEYLATLAGQSDETIFTSLLGADVDVDELIRERVRRYCDLVADVMPERAREALAFAAARVPVAIVTSAHREEVDAVLRAAAVAQHVSVLVCADDVARLKPDPAPYLLACARLGFAPAAALALEDSPAGVAAAKAAGVRCVAVTTTTTRERLHAADDVIAAVDGDAVAALLA